MTYFKPKIITGFAAAGLACVLAACAGGSNVKLDAEVLASVEQKTELVATKTFSTEGKPTKTIETPWGPREVYDPVKDEVVRAAFKRIHDRDEGVVHEENSVGHPSLGHARKTYVLRDILDEFGNQTILPNGVVKKGFHDRTPDADDLIVMQSLIEQRLDYRDLKCKRLQENTCNQTYIYRDNYYNEEPSYSVSQPAVLCLSVPKDGKRIYNKTQHPIGKQFFEMQWLSDGGIQPLPEPLDYKAQVENYFFIECLKW